MAISVVHLTWQCAPHTMSSNGENTRVYQCNQPYLIHCKLVHSLPSLPTPPSHPSLCKSATLLRPPTAASAPTPPHHCVVEIEPPSRVEHASVERERERERWASHYRNLHTPTSSEIGKAALQIYRDGSSLAHSSIIFLALLVCKQCVQPSINQKR